MNRYEEMTAAVDNLIRAHAAWKASQQDAPDLSYWDAEAALITVFTSGDIPYDGREINEAVMNLAIHSEAFDAGGIPDPPQSYWAAYEAVVAIRNRMEIQEEKTLEPISVLDRQGVPHEQIARIWGLVDPKTGRGQAYLVQRELDKPGSVITKDYVHPDRRRTEREREAANRNVASATASRPRKVEPCPETPMELFEQGVPPNQAAKMLGITEDEANAQWAELKEHREETKRKQLLRESEEAAARRSAPSDNPFEKSEAELAAAKISDAPADPPAPPLDDFESKYATYDLPGLRKHASELGIGLRGNENRREILNKLRQKAEAGA